MKLILLSTDSNKENLAVEPFYKEISPPKTVVKL